MSKYGVFSGPYIPAFGLNTEYLSVFSPNAGKYGPEKLRIWTIFSQWELEMKESSLETDPYATTIRIKNKTFDNLITAGHIPRERSQHVHFFVITKGKKINEHVK